MTFVSRVRICATAGRRRFGTSTQLRNHENPLGLPTNLSAGSSGKVIRPDNVARRPPASRGANLPPKRRIAHVDHVIAVSSAKGGVGKSTVAVNLALALSRSNLRTGILDADIFGPSIPTLLNLTKADPPEVTDRGSLVPLQSYGIRSMSMGYLLPSESAPVAWRGAMVQKALHQLLHEVDWSPKLDVLVLDMPPGTGDVQLTIGQQVELTGALIVSTPQDIALKDAVKGISMFKTMKIPVLGLVQNMSGFVCPNCGEESRIFSHNSAGTHGAVDVQSLGIPILGHIPLHANICHDADAGRPTIVAEEASGQSINSRFYNTIASQLAAKLDLSRT